MDAWQAAAQHALESYPTESVGYIKDGIYHRLENKSGRPDAFVVDSTVLLQEPEVLVHSHCHSKTDPTYDPSVPSYLDLDSQIKTGIEWAIIVTDGEECDPPLRWGNPATRPPLEGRPFIHSMYDCLELCRDWYALNRDIRLPAQPRQPDWWLKGEDYMGQLYTAWGFEQVDRSKLEVGDVLFYQVPPSKVINHLGLYVGNDTILTHWFGRLSGIEPLYKHLRHCVFAARYTK